MYLLRAETDTDRLETTLPAQTDLPTPSAESTIRSD